MNIYYLKHYPILGMSILCFAFLGVLLFNVSCTCKNKKANNEMMNSIDEILENGGSRYDVAAFLLRNPDYEGSESDLYSYLKSGDGKICIYSICREIVPAYIYQFDNIAHYKVDESEKDVKADLDFYGWIQQIGIQKTGDKTYYLLVSNLHLTHQGEMYYFTVSAYSLVNDGSFFEPESIFKTKDGSTLQTIEVKWDDFGYRYSADNLWGIYIDSESNTKRVYVQLVDDEPGEARDVAFVYEWDGSYFVYTGRESAHFPAYKDN